MLKGINPLLTPDLLKLLMEMGHDDSVFIADANFTAMSIAAGKPVIRLPGTGLVPRCRPLAHRCRLKPLQVTRWHSRRSAKCKVPTCPVQQEVLGRLAPSLQPHQSAEALERMTFNDRARAACAVVITGAPQPYGNFILRKGVICEPLCL